MPNSQLPDIDFDPKATIIARKSFIRFKRAGGVAPADVLNIIVQKVDFDPSQDFVENKVPKGRYIIKNRKVPKEKKFILKPEIGDLKPVLKFFKTLPFSEDGTAEVFICDPDDEAGKVAIHLKEFACNAASSGSMTFDGDNFSKITVEFEALDDVDFELDAAVEALAP